MKKRMLAVLLALCLVVGLLPVAAAAGNTFADVDPDEWYGDEVAYVYKEGLMNGIDTVNGLFDPTGTTSRAMVWAILARMDGETISGATWVEQARAWAMANGVSDGTDPDGIITREMFATMLYRYAISKGYDVSVGEDTNILSYPDAFGVSEWAVPAMQWAVGAGIITNLDGQLAPQTGAQRCMVAVMLYRVCENVVKPEAEPEPTPAPTPTPTPSRPVDPDYYVHYHSWDQGVVTTEPTCTADGVKTFTCYCGDTYTETVDATGEHTYQWIIDVEATEEAVGKMHEECAVCHTRRNENTEIPKKDHVMTKTDAVEATCTTDGNVEYWTCSGCSKKFADATGTTEIANVVTPAKGHSYTAVVTAPTCTGDGYTTYTCSACGDTYTGNTVSAAHSWNDGVVTTQPTCIAEGKKTYTCTVCRETKTEEVDPADHSWNDGVVTVPTCTKNGYTTYTCTVCGNTKTADVVVTGGHVWDNGVETSRTCMAGGYTTFTCTVCRVTEKRNQSVPLGHEWDGEHGTVTLAPTCAVPGVKTITCTRCNQTMTEEIATTTIQHTWEDIVSSGSLCTEDQLRRCKVCHAVERKAEGVGEHKMSEWTVTDDSHSRHCEATVGESQNICAYEESGPHSYGPWEYDCFTGTRTCICGKSETVNYEAKIGDQYYLRLDDAVDAAGNNAIIELADTPADEPYMTVPNNSKNITYKGGRGVVFNFGQNQIAISAVTFDGVTIKWREKDGAPYQGIKDCQKLVYRNCAIEGMQYLYTHTVEFDNCTLTNLGCWAVCTYGANIVNFTGCTFNTGGHAVNNYSDDDHNDDNNIYVTFTNCTFNDSGTVGESDWTLSWGGPENLVEHGVGNGTEDVWTTIFNNCDYNFKGSAEAHKHTLWGNKNSRTETLRVIIDGVTVTPVTTSAGQAFVVPVTYTDGLKRAVANAKAGVPLVVELADGTYNFSGVDLTSKTITFKGSKNVNLTMSTVEAAGAIITFEGVTVNWDSNEGYQGLKNAAKVVYQNCDINGLQYLYGDADFINCIFTQKSGYCVWTYGAANVTFTGCTFYSGGKAIFVYNEETNISFVANIDLINCTFHDDGTYTEKNKAAVETGSNGGNTATSNKYNLTFTNCTTNGFEANNSTSPLWGNKNSMDTDHLTVTIDGVMMYGPTT